jgi:hypothetical protein
MAHRAVVRSTLVAAVAVLVLTGGPVAAHETEPGLALELHGVRPAASGLEVEAVEVLAPTLRVHNTTDEPFEVIGADGTPFLRIGPTGVEANLTSADFYRSEAPAPSASIPSGADAGAQPHWVRIADDPQWAWFEHRISRSRVAGSHWSIPARLGEHPLSVDGSWIQVPQRGSFRTVLERVTPEVAALEVRLLPGTVPVLAVRNDTGERLTVLDASGAAFVHIGPDAAEQVDAAGRWHRVADEPQWVWAEPRAAWPEPQPPADALEATAPVRLTAWSVPASLGGQDITIEGTVEWVPVVSHHATGLGLSVLLAASGLLALVAVAWRRRATARRSQPT